MWDLTIHPLIAPKSSLAHYRPGIGSDTKRFLAIVFYLIYRSRKISQAWDVGQHNSIRSPSGHSGSGCVSDSSTALLCKFVGFLAETDEVSHEEISGILIAFLLLLMLMLYMIFGL